MFLPGFESSGPSAEQSLRLWAVFPSQGSGESSNIIFSSPQECPCAIPRDYLSDTPRLLRKAPDTFNSREGQNDYLPNQGQVSAEVILHLANPNLGSNSGMRSFEPRILGSNSGVEFCGPMFSNKESPPPPKKFTPKKFTSKNSHQKIPNFYSRRIILGNFVCFVSTKENCKEIDIELPSKNYPT